VPSKFTESIDKEQAAIASVDSLPDEGAVTLAAARKGGNLQAFEVGAGRSVLLPSGHR